MHILHADVMSMDEIAETAVYHVEAAGDLAVYLGELQRKPKNEIVVPPPTDEGEALTYLHRNKFL